MTSERPDLTLRYAEEGLGDDGVVDVHLPGGELPSDPLTPLVVLVHGGFWRAAYDRRHPRPLARALAEEGVVVASPEYRRVGPGGGGGWPTTGDDVRRAVDALPGLLASVGVPTGPLRLTGHSAGGHLVLWLIATGVRAERVVPLAPVCDLAESVRLHLGDGAATDLMGDQDTDEADPMLLLRDVPADRPEVTIVHGRDDDIVPISLSSGLVAAHPWVRLDPVPGDHFTVVDPTSDAWPVVRDALTR